MRVGVCAHEGSTNISIIDAESYWIDGYFEETKMAHVCVCDRAEAQLMGYAASIVGRVKSITGWISVSDASPNTQGLPNVNPVYTWVRLAQRVPVRIAIEHVPPGVPLVSGMTVTVTIRDAEDEQGNWFGPRYQALKRHFSEIVHAQSSRRSCGPGTDQWNGSAMTVNTPKPPQDLAPEQINPGLTPGMAISPHSR